MNELNLWGMIWLQSPFVHVLATLCLHGWTSIRFDFLEENGTGVG